MSSIIVFFATLSLTVFCLWTTLSTSLNFTSFNQIGFSFYNST